jgi:hypothetical protein
LPDRSRSGSARTSSGRTLLCHVGEHERAPGPPAMHLPRALSGLSVTGPALRAFMATRPCRAAPHRTAVDRQLPRPIAITPLAVYDVSTAAEDTPPGSVLTASPAPRRCGCHRRPHTTRELNQITSAAVVRVVARHTGMQQ